jgi:lipid II:glycine glycyltransferase (peptidoglycan interpeptide bridge formation enzyme)
MKKITESFPRNALEQAKMVYDGWRELLQKMDVPNFSLTDFEQKINEANEKVEIAEKMREERKQAIETRNEVLEEIWDLTKRIRNAAKATFGDDSKEIEKFGGKPVRFRKHYGPYAED